jgi:hypothetical protein
MSVNGAIPLLISHVIASSRSHKPRQLGFDDLGGVLVRIYNGNDHEGISLLYHRPGGYCIFFAAVERLICPSTLKRNRSSVGRA